MNTPLITAKQLLDDICDKYRQHNTEIMQGVDGEKAHALDVLGWVEKLHPKPTLALQLAALFHDIDRVVTPQEGGGYKGDRKSQEYSQHKKDHAKRSAAFIIPHLKKIKVNEETLKRVELLILHHDDRGSEVEENEDQELNFLAAADTFAFFTSIWPKLIATEGMERVKDKSRFMVDKTPDFLRAQLFELQLKNGDANEVKNQIIQEYYRNNNPADKWYTFCPNCKRKLTHKSINGRNRPFCEKCKFTFWGNPRLCTSVILEKNGAILLIKRSQDPLKEYWCLPGGIVEYHELVEQSLIRETIEETGYKIKIDKLIGIYRIDNDSRGVGQDVIYSGVITSGTKKISKEHDEINYFSPSQLPKRIAYKHREAINDYFFQ